MPRTSERYRRLLRKECEALVSSGYTCFPKWVDSKAPAFHRGEHYQRFLVEPLINDEEFAKLVLERFSDPRVGGIVVAGGVGGLVGIDYDAPKVSGEAAARAKRALGVYGGVVYAESRYEYLVKRDKVLGRGWHFFLRVPVERLTGKKITVRHAYQAEFTVKHYGLLTISPSVYVTRDSFSAYLKLSRVELAATLYDRKLDTLPRLVEDLGGRLVLADNPPPPRSGSGKTSEPWHGLNLGVGRDDVYSFLKNYAALMDCPGLLRLVESLERGEPMPVPYFIYQDYVSDANHPRSSWTIVENLVARILAEAGARDDAFEEIERAFRRSEELYEKIRGPTGHATLGRNIEAAKRFNEHGHDKTGACVFKLAGLCEKSCLETGFTKLRSSAARSAMAKAYARARGIA